jgi:hypothetical protein
MSSIDPLLFSELDLRRVLDAQLRTMVDEIDKYDARRLLNTSVDDLAEYFVRKFQVAAPSLQDGQAAVAADEEGIDVSHDPSRYLSDRSRPFYLPGTRFTVRVPFTGDAELFRCQPSQFTLNPPRGRASEKILFVSHLAMNPEENEIKEWCNRSLASIRAYLETIAKDVVPFNAGLPEQARGRIEARRARLLKSQRVAASLGFKLEARADAPRTYAVELRPASPPPPPRASTAAYVPEPALADVQYKQILSILRPMGSTMERDPSAFRGLGEEKLRTFFLAALNSHFQGGATGETFNAAGRTDILIRVDDQNIFVAECKVWKGSESLRQAIDQALSYLVWRDTKVAILLFSRFNKDFTAVLRQIDPTVRSHACFKRELDRLSDSESAYRCHHPDDTNRELTLTVMAFHLPK